MNGGLILLVIFVTTVSQSDGLDQPEAVSLELSKIKNIYVRNDLSLATKIWYGVAEHNQQFLGDVKKYISDYSDNLIEKKFIGKQQQISIIKQFLKRNIDGMESMSGILDELFVSIGKHGTDVFLKVLQEIESARSGKLVPSNERCKPNVIKTWRNLVHNCSWTGLGNAKEMFHYLSNHLEDGYNGLVDVSLENVTDEILVQRFEDATVVTEEFIKKYKTKAKNDLRDIETTFVTCLEKILTEVDSEKLCA